MLFFVTTILLQLCAKNMNALKYRTDYLWAQQFETFYRVHDVATTWEQARQICEAEGTSLLLVDSIDELESLKILFSNIKAEYNDIFIGIHDKFSSGEFVTVKGTPIKDTVLELFWAEGKPNMNGTEHCVVMTREALFEDRPCDDIYPFVCKIFKNETNPNDDCDNYDLGYKPQKNGKCYKLALEPLSWHDAYLVCKAEEGQLAIVNSAEEAKLITKMLEDQVTNAPDPNIVYIGFSDLMCPYQYRTITGKSLKEAGYATWTPIKDKDESTLQSKRCGALTRTGYLKMEDCNQIGMFLCERSANPTIMTDS